MARSTRTWYTALTAGKLLSFPALLVLFWLLPQTQGPWVLIGLASILVFLIYSLKASDSPLSIAWYENGSFWVSGVSKEFLRAVQQSETDL